MTCALVALLGLIAAPPLAGTRVAVIADDGSRPYEDAIQGLTDAGATVERWKATDRDLGARLRKPEGRTVLALGPKSAALLARSGTGPRAALVPRARDAPAGLAAVTLEIPFGRQLAWLASAFPDRRRVLVVRGDKAADPELRGAARQAGFTLELADVARAGEAVPAAQAVLQRGRRGAILWLLPDPIAVTADTLSPLLQTSLAYRVPSVGFSRYFLRAGALAAVVVDYRAAALQAVALARAGEARVEPAAAARLVVDGRLAERLGIAVGAGAGIEVNR